MPPWQLRGRWQDGRRQQTEELEFPGGESAGLSRTCRGLAADCPRSGSVRLPGYAEGRQASCRAERRSKAASVDLEAAEKSVNEQTHMSGALLRTKTKKSERAGLTEGPKGEILALTPCRRCALCESRAVGRGGRGRASTRPSCRRRAEPSRTSVDARNSDI